MDTHETDRKLKRMYYEQQMHTEDLIERQYINPDDEYIPIWCDWHDEMCEYYG